ncbi:MAG: leucine-rich repeat protein [Bacilli bacterium]|nr:leucine-rich repeat protein [Clostridia bacterium]MBR4618105.1 leucine-rich repeat protein [Bacilli bacterium]
MTESVKQVLYRTNSFSNNKNITSVNLNNATFVNGNMFNVFSNCTNLTSVSNIGNSTVDMAYTFVNCNKLTSVGQLPNSVVNMYNTFYNCRALSTTPVLPNAVKVLTNTFYYTNINTTPDIPNSVTSLDNTFRGCYNLTTITPLPDTIQYMYGTFAYCNKLTSIPAIPPKVTNLASTFVGCNGFTNVTVPNTISELSYTFQYCNKLTTVTIPDSVTSMYGTFSRCKSLVTPPTIPNSVTSMGSTFSYCTGLSSYPVFPEHITGFQYMFQGCTQFTTFYQLPANATYIYGIFSGCSNMAGSYNIPSTIEREMGYAFSGCSKLTGSITVPEKVVDCYSSFQSCTNLSEVIFNCNNTCLNYCCNGCTGLTDVTFNCNHINNTWYAFRNCNNLRNVSGCINSGNIGWIFQNCQNLTNCNLVLGDIHNGSLAFSSCINLENLNMTINSVNNAASFFSGCSKLTSFIDIPGAGNLDSAYEYVSIPTTPPNIANTVKNLSFTFGSCTNLTDMPNLTNCTNLTIMSSAFYNCTNLVNITTIPNSVTDMYGTFANCISLTSVPVIPENVGRIDDLFRNCTSLTGNIYIRSDKANMMYDRAFTGTSLQKNVYIPYTYNNGVHTIVYNSFINYSYDENGTTDGVYLKPGFMYLNMSLPTNSTLYINGEVVTNAQQLTLKEDTDYVLIKEGYVPYTKHIIYQEGITTDSIVDADLSNNGVTLTINPTQADVIIEFTYLGMTSVANSCMVASGTQVTYKVKKSGYKKEIQTVTVTEDTTITVTLEESEIPTTPGSRIGNIATVVGTFIDNSGKSYVYAVLDSIYRDLNAPDYLPMKDFDPEEYHGTPPNLPMYGEYTYNATYMTTNGNIESATHNTDVMIDYYKDYNPYDSEYYRLNPEEIPDLDESYYYETIYHIARNAAVVTLDGERFESQLPNTYELNQIWQNKAVLDGYDPTLLEDSSQSLTNVFDENRENLRVWSSTLGEAFYEIKLWGVCRRWDDPIELTVSWAQGNGRVVPIFEIPLD